MIEQFAMTKNVQEFIKAVELVQTPIKGRIGNALIYGPPGTGKSETALWYAQENDIPYIRAKAVGSRRTLLCDILVELGETPLFRADDIFNQIVDQLLSYPRPIIIDEVDYLIKDSKVELLRDINDMTNTPVIMLGMQNVESELEQKFKHLCDRFTVIVKLSLFDRKGLIDFAEDICETPLSDCAIDHILRQGQGKLRLTTIWLVRAESIARRNKDIELVTAEHLQSITKR